MIDQNLQTNLHTPLQTNQFTIEQNAHMFSMLIGKVYNDLILAPVREWSTNAVDAHILASNPDPFNVHLPTQDEPYFAVRDFGPGLSEDDILGLFSSFGSSTKRDSNAYNGAFGIGRMSGLAYATSFTVDSYHNGTHYSYLITLQDGIPVNARLFDSPTSEPNGLKLTLSVRVQDIHLFHDRAKNLYKYFDLKPLLNIELDISTPLASQLCDDWYFHDDGYRSYVLMANVRYQIDISKIKTHNFERLILKMPTGSVSITPGRESLSYDDKTIAAIQAAYDNVLSTSLSHAQDYINEQTTPYQQMLIYSDMANSLPSEVARQLTISDLTALGYLTPVPQGYRCSYRLSASALDCSFKYRQRYSSKAKSTDKIALQSLKDITFVLCDSVQTQHAIDSIASENPNNSLLIMSKSSGQLQPFLNTIIPHLQALQIPYIATSSYEAPDKVKVERLGVYYLPFNGKSFYSSKKARPNTQYLYIPLSGYSPLPEYEPYLDLYRLLDPVNSLYLIGIQQKYLAEAQANPNFTLFGEAYVESVRQAGPYIIADRCENYISAAFTSTPLPNDVPELCLLHQSEMLHYNLLVNKPNYRNPRCKPLFDKFDIPYTYYTTTVTRDMLSKYPLYHDLRDKDDFIYYLRLEYIRELHSSPSDQHPSLHNT